MSPLSPENPDGVPRAQVERLRWHLLELMRSHAAGDIGSLIPETDFEPTMLRVVRTLNTLLRLHAEGRVSTDPRGLTEAAQSGSSLAPPAMQKDLAVAMADLAIDLGPVAENASRGDFRRALDTSSRQGFALVIATDINTILKAALSNQFDIVLPAARKDGD